MSRIKVLLVSVSFAQKSGLGVIEHGVRIYSGMKRYGKGIEPHVYNLTNSGLFNFINKKTREYKLEKGLKDRTVRLKPDIIHYMSPGIFLSSMALKPFFNPSSKQVVSIHDLDMIKKIPKIGVHKYTNSSSSIPLRIINEFVHRAERRGFLLAVKKADRIICVSEMTRDGLVDMFNMDPEKISVIYNIVDGRFRRMRSRKPKEKVIIGHLSSYAYNKNAKVLVNAFRKVKSDRYELHLYGAKLPFDISKDSRIKYFGHAHDTVKMYNSFDVFVFPSKWEGFGMPIMEAKRCRIPVITYGKGELPDVVKRNTLQFGNREELTDILEKKKWEKVDVEKAYKDTKNCEEKVVIRQLKQAYRKVLEEE